MRYLTLKQVADLFQLSESTISRLWRSDASFSAIKLGASVRIDAEALDRWIPRKMPRLVRQAADVAGSSRHQSLAPGSSSRLWRLILMNQSVAPRRRRTLQDDSPLCATPGSQLRRFIYRAIRCMSSSGAPRPRIKRQPKNGGLRAPRSHSVRRQRRAPQAPSELAPDAHAEPLRRGGCEEQRSSKSAPGTMRSCTCQLRDTAEAGQ